MPYAKEWLSSCSRMATACSLPPAALWSPPSGVCQENSSNKTLLHVFSMSCHRSSVWFLKLQVSQDKSSLFSQGCNPASRQVHGPLHVVLCPKEQTGDQFPVFPSRSPFIPFYLSAFLLQFCLFWTALLQSKGWETRVMQTKWWIGPLH